MGGANIEHSSGGSSLEARQLCNVGTGRLLGAKIFEAMFEVISEVFDVMSMDMFSGTSVRMLAGMCCDRGQALRQKINASRAHRVMTFAGVAAKLFFKFSAHFERYHHVSLLPRWKRRRMNISSQCHMTLVCPTPIGMPGIPFLIF